MTQPPKDPANAGESDEQLRSLDSVIFEHTNPEDFEARLRMLVANIRQDNVPYPKEVWTGRIERIFKEANYIPKPNLLEQKPADPEIEKAISDVFWGKETAVQGDDLREQIRNAIGFMSPERVARLSIVETKIPANRFEPILDECMAAIQAQVDANYYPKSKLADAIVKNPETVDRLIAGESLYTQAQVDEAVREARVEELEAVRRANDGYEVPYQYDDESRVDITDRIEQLTTQAKPTTSTTSKVLMAFYPNGDHTQIWPNGDTSYQEAIDYAKRKRYALKLIDTEGKDTWIIKLSETDGIKPNKEDV